jgi:alpha-beta hydrolase superfamily lysophospholipase
MVPPGVARPPVVVIFGGADGWKEEYHLGACYLIERGIAAVLLDGPGQGETRLFHRIHMTEPPDLAFSAVLSYLLDHPEIGDRVGIWGNSLGGNFAARAASFDPRFAACCVNSGSAMPVAGFRRYPRLQEKRFAMVGRRDEATADTIFEALALSPNDNRIGCPLLVLHGVPDALFTVAEARSLYDDAPSTDKTLMLWEDGDHCIYNHSHEKHALIADWFADRLGGNRVVPAAPR